LLAVPRLVSESRMVREHHRPDVAGAATGTAALVAIVYSLLGAASHPWGSWQVLVPVLGGVGLGGLTVWIEARSDAPLIPLQFFANRTRVVTNFVTLFFTSAFFSYFFLLTLFEQQILGYSPLSGGLSYVPFGLSIGAGIGLGTTLMPRIGVKPLLSVGYLGAAVGLFLTSGIDVHSSYLGGVGDVGSVMLAHHPALGDQPRHRQQSPLAYETRGSPGPHRGC
jgi:predicted MFS family arabinose efflux permease